MKVRSKNVKINTAQTSTFSRHQVKAVGMTTDRSVVCTMYNVV